MSQRVIAASLIAALSCLGCGHSTAPRTSTPASSTETPAVTRYANPQLRIELQFPATWRADPTNDFVIGGVSTRFSDPRGREYGYIYVSAAAALSLANAVDAQAHHKRRPYGETPIIVEKSFAAGRATLIFPDPSSPQIHDAALVMEIPQVVIGRDTFRFLVLYTDAEDIQAVAESLRLTD